jgi:hypothetical protein
MEARKDAYSVMVGKPERKVSLGTPRHRCKGNIKIDIKEIVWEGVNWIDLVKDRDN